MEDFVFLTKDENVVDSEDKVLFETNDPEMARRMCACLNQCIGISTEDLENDLVKKALTFYRMTGGNKKNA